MKEEIISDPIGLICVTADSFPEGIMQAYDGLHQLVPDDGSRRIFGLSRMEHGKIIYKAAAEEFHQDEATDLGAERIIIPAGNYASIIVEDFMNNMSKMSETFQELISRPDIDRDGYCIEWYYNTEDVKCMVRLADK